MYVPDHFAEDDRDAQMRFIRETGWGYLTGVVDGAPFVTHLPFLLDGDPGAEFLVAHMARLNPHWRSFADVGEQLVVFPGPHCYVSPTWYAAEKAVPTWNYAAVHAYGPPRIIEDPDDCYAAQKKLVDFHEAQFETPWRIEDMPESYIGGMLRGIVNFEIPIARVEAKFKLNQNRTAQDRAGVVAALGGSPRENDRAVAALMVEREAPDG